MRYHIPFLTLSSQVKPGIIRTYQDISGAWCSSLHTKASAGLMVISVLGNGGKTTISEGNQAEGEDKHILQALLKCSLSSACYNISIVVYYYLAPVFQQSLTILGG
jgi:hypothetical protein